MKILVLSVSKLKFISSIVCMYVCMYVYGNRSRLASSGVEVYLYVRQVNQLCRPKTLNTYSESSADRQCNELRIMKNRSYEIRYTSFTAERDPLANST